MIENKRHQYQQKRKKQLKKIAGLKNDMDEEDLDLYYEFKPWRDKANREI